MENFSPNNFEDDHILARYWLVLIRRWWIVGIVFIVVFGSGIVYAKTRPPLPFPHITTIEIGRIADGQALEDIRMVESKMKKAYIPIILQEHANKNGYDQKRYSIEIEIPEEGNTLILRADGDQNETETLLTLEQKIVDLLIEDHQQKSGLMKNELAQQQFDAKLRLDYLIEQGQLMPHKRQLIEETGQLLKRQIETVANLINAAEKDRAAALASAIEKGSVDQSLTTAILLMNETISENREKLRGLEERYYITLQNQRTEIDKEELENKRQQKEQEQLIKDAEFRSNNLQETKVLLPPSRLLREASRGPVQAAGVFGVAGIFLGIFAAGFVEFASNARKYEKTVGRA